jgi:hypothetical protein
MTKQDLINGLSILLCLDKSAATDLNKLKIDSLEQMFYSYKENALAAQRKLEEAVEKANKHGVTTRSNTRTRRNRRAVESRIQT